MKRAMILTVGLLLVACSDGRREVERLVEQGRYEEAISKMEALLAEDGDEPALRAALAKGYLDAGDPRRAKEEFERAVKSGSSEDDLRAPLVAALVENGTKLMDQRNYYQAEGYLRDAAALDPGNSEVQGALGVVLVETGRSKEGMDYLRDAVREKPDDPRLEKALGDAYYRSNRPTEAQGHYRKAVEAGLEEALLYARLAGIALAAGDYSQAQLDLTRGLEIDSDSFEIRKTLGDFHHRLSSYDEAVNQYEKALRINPNDSNARAQMGLALEKLDRTSEAEKELLKAVEVDPEAVVALEYLMSLYFEDKRFEEYESVCKKILSIDSDHRNAQLGLNWLEMQKRGEVSP